MNGFVSFCSTGTFGIVKNRPRSRPRPRFGKTGIEDDDEDENDYDSRIGVLSPFIGFMPRYFGAVILLTSAATR
jgi:hypothetical protein